jgi:antitoxin HicB
MEYPATIEAVDGTYIVRFPDVDEAITEGSSSGEAFANAEDALAVALLGRMKDGDEVPAPSRPKKGQVLVSLPAQSAAKLAFYQAFRQSGLTRVALAARIGKDEAEVRRMLDPHHATKLSALEDGVKAMGKRLSVTLQSAA